MIMKKQFLLIAFLSILSSNPCSTSSPPQQIHQKYQSSWPADFNLWYRGLSSENQTKFSQSLENHEKYLQEVKLEIPERLSYYRKLSKWLFGIGSILGLGTAWYMKQTESWLGLESLLAMYTTVMLFQAGLIYIDGDNLVIRLKKEEALNKKILAHIKKLHAKYLS